MRDKRDSRTKRFIEALTLHGTVYHAAQAAGVSRQTAYRWWHEDSDFADQWDEAIENAVDAVESTIYQQAVGGNTLAAIFYLKAHRPIYRDRLNIGLNPAQRDRRENGATHSDWRLDCRGVAKLTEGKFTPCREVDLAASEV